MRLENAMNGFHPLQNRETSQKITSVKEESATQSLKEQEKTLEDLQNVKKPKDQTIISMLHESFKPLHTNLKYEFHEKLKEYYVTIVNPATDEVIKEIPSKKMLDFYAAMAEFTGILIDEKI